MTSCLLSLFALVLWSLGFGLVGIYGGGDAESNGDNGGGRLLSG